MATVGVAPQKSREDPLAYLPCSSVVEYKQGAIIYGHDQPCDTLYLILSGVVNISRLGDHGEQLLLDLYRTDEFFGESSLLNLFNTAEQAVCHQKTKLMAWRPIDIDEIITKRPRLAVALLQTFGQRSFAFTRRIETLVFDTTDRRLARSLIHFSERLGTLQPDGGVVMDPLTHDLLAQYVGTSREVVTCHMVQFRRLGYLQYSRKAIVLYRDALKSWLAESSVPHD